MREAPKKTFGIYFLIDPIWSKMVHNHDHAGVKWGVCATGNNITVQYQNKLITAGLCTLSIIVFKLYLDIYKFQIYLYEPLDDKFHYKINWNLWGFLFTIFCLGCLCTFYLNFKGLIGKILIECMWII